MLLRIEIFGLYKWKQKTQSRNRYRKQIIRTRTCMCVVNAFKKTIPWYIIIIKQTIVRHGDKFAILSLIIPCMSVVCSMNSEKPSMLKIWEQD